MAPRTVAPSALCTTFDLATARSFDTSLAYSPQVAPDDGSAPEVCTYSTATGMMVALTPAQRPFDTERSLAASLAKDPATAQMSSATVEDVSGLGSRAFLERAARSETPAASVAFLVWEHGARSWVLTYSGPGDGALQTDATTRLVELARRLTTRMG